MPSTARIERAHSDRARSASKEGTWTLPPPNSLSCAGPRVLSNGFDGFPQNFNHASEFQKRRGEWRHEDHDIADWAEQEPSAARLHGYLVADPLFEPIGFLRLPIRYQLDRHDESLLPDLAHRG